jgi:hypothetical protein
LQRILITLNNCKFGFKSWYFYCKKIVIRCSCGLLFIYFFKKLKNSSMKNQTCFKMKTKSSFWLVMDKVQ